MLTEHFTPYKEMILRSINSCLHPVHLICCHDMVDRFKEVFKFHSIKEADRQAAYEEIENTYLQKSHELHF
jgi:hypothetical protein